MTVKRLNEFNQLEAQLITGLYREVKHLPRDGQWRVFKGTLEFRGNKYEVEVEFMFNGQFLSFQGEKKIALQKDNEIRKIILPTNYKAH